MFTVPVVHKNHFSCMMLSKTSVWVGVSKVIFKKQILFGLVCPLTRCHTESLLHFKISIFGEHKEL